MGISAETKKQEEAHASKVAAAEALEAELLAAPKPAWPEASRLPGSPADCPTRRLTRARTRTPNPNPQP